MTQITVLDDRTITAGEIVSIAEQVGIAVSSHMLLEARTYNNAADLQRFGRPCKGLHLMIIDCEVPSNHGSKPDKRVGLHVVYRLLHDVSKEEERVIVIYSHHDPVWIRKIARGVMSRREANSLIIIPKSRVGVDSKHPVVPGPIDAQATRVARLANYIKSDDHILLTAYDLGLNRLFREQRIIKGKPDAVLCEIATQQFGLALLLADVAGPECLDALLRRIRIDGEVDPVHYLLSGDFPQVDEVANEVCLRILSNRKIADVVEPVELATTSPDICWWLFRSTMELARCMPLDDTLISKAAHHLRDYEAQLDRSDPQNAFNFVRGVVIRYRRTKADEYVTRAEIRQSNTFITCEEDQGL